MRKILLATFLIAITFVSNAQTLTSGGKLKPEQAIMDIRHYTIALNVDFNQRSIEGYTTIDLVLSQPTHVLLFDLLDSLNIHNVLVNGKKQAFDYKNNLITINLDK